MSYLVYLFLSLSAYELDRLLIRFPQAQWDNEL